jgi:hypothetical protein
MGLNDCVGAWGSASCGTGETRFLVGVDGLWTQSGAWLHGGFGSRGLVCGSESNFEWSRCPLVSFVKRLLS